MIVDADFFDGIFDDGYFSPERIQTAGVRVMGLAQTNREEAEKAELLLGRMLLLGIANGLPNARECAIEYFTVMEAAFGESTQMDKLKKRLGIEGSDGELR